jgi:hypothetical protein
VRGAHTFDPAGRLERTRDRSTAGTKTPVDGKANVRGLQVPGGWLALGLLRETEEDGVRRPEASKVELLLEAFEGP